MRNSALLFALFAVISGCAPPPDAGGPPHQGKRSALRFVATEWRPYTDGSKGTRLALDFVAGVFREAGRPSRFQIVPDGALETALEGSKFTGAAALWWSVERSARFVYSEGYFENQLVLASGNGSDVEVASLAAIGRKKVALVFGYAYGEDVAEAKETEFVRAATLEEAFRSMVGGDVDYLLADRLVISRRMDGLSAELKLGVAVGKKAVERRSLHVAVRKELPEALALVDEFNRGLDRALRDGSYHRAFGVNWVLTDLDGDGREEFVSSGNGFGPQPPELETTVRVPRRAFGEAAKGAGAVLQHEAPSFIVLGEKFASWVALLERLER